MSFTTASIGRELGGDVIGDPDVVLSGFASADRARPGDLTFAEKDAYFAAAEASQASAIVVSGAFLSATKVIIRVANPRVAAARALAAFYPEPVAVAGIHPSACIDPRATVDPSAQVGPLCAIGPGARIGARSILMGGNHVGGNCVIGDDVRLFPNVVLYAGTQVGNRVSIHAGTVVGSDGYGYVFTEGRHLKMPQVGQVIIHDDVEIGANSAVDCGALGPTVIGAGTKIDNLVHLAHNVQIGRHCLIMGQVGFAGSTQLGDYGVIASQSGIGGHLMLGHQVTVGGKSGVMRDVADKEVVLGFPAVPDKQAKRQWVGIQKLPELLLRIRELEKRVLEERTQP